MRDSFKKAMEIFDRIVEMIWFVIALVAFTFFLIWLQGSGLFGD